MFTNENTITIPFMLAFMSLSSFKEHKITWWKRFIFYFFILNCTNNSCNKSLIQGYSQSDPNVTFKASTSMNRMHYFYTQMNVIIDYIKNSLFLIILISITVMISISTTIWENNSYISGNITIIGIFSLLVIKKTS